MAFHAFKNKTEAFSFASKLCADAIRKTIETNAHASMLLSGGTTPAPLYERLSHETLSWSRLTGVDARTVFLDIADDS